MTKAVLFGLITLEDHMTFFTASASLPKKWL
jgi:hypothetical protein